MSISAAPNDAASTFIATDDATGDAADTGTTGGSSTATAGTSKGVQKVCGVCEEWYAIIPASVSSIDCPLSCTYNGILCALDILCVLPPLVFR